MLKLLAGISLVSVIIAYVVQLEHERTEDRKHSDNLAIAVFSIWSIAIIIDIFVAHGYTFTAFKRLI